MESAKKPKTSFRTGDIAAVAIAFMVVLTPIHYIVLSTPAAPGVDDRVFLMLYLPFLALSYLAIVRGVMMKVRVDERGVLVRNFWTTRRFEWGEFVEFLPPGDGVTSFRSCGQIRTASNGTRPMTAIQANNLMLIMGRGDVGAKDLTREMSQAAAICRSTSTRDLQ